MKIAIDAVSKLFGKFKALDAVTLEIQAGEIFFLLGPSGCGKTTLLRIIAGFCQPDAGTVSFDGQPVNDLPPHRRNAAMVFQNYALWPHMTVAENVAFGLTVPGRNPPQPEREKRVRAMLESMQLSNLADRTPAQLSGGQQQRVALARAMVVEPACLLLDEPLSNLDAKLRQEMRVEIRRLIKNSGITAVYVTHDQQEALSMADRCAVLQAGRIAQTGAPARLYAHPKNRFVADFIGGANLRPGTIRAVESDGRLRVAMGAAPASGAGPRETIWHGRPASDGASMQPGQAVTLCIRPECIRLADIGAGGNVFFGTVTETLYYGHAMEYWINLPDGSNLRAVLPAGTASESRATPAGTGVKFQVDPSDVLILPE